MYIFAILFHRNMEHQRQSQRLVMAREAAQSTLDEMRVWAADFDNFRSNFAPYTGAPVTRSGYENYPVTVRVGALQEAKSPCSTFCDDYGARGKTIDNSLRPVQVSVPVRTGHDLVLNSYLGVPSRQLRTTNPIVVSRVSGPPGVLNFQDTIRVQAQAFDSADRPVEDVTFSWSVIPDSSTGDPGAGTYDFDNVNRRRDQADFTHVVYEPGPIWPGDPVPEGGRCRLRATAVVFGGSHTGELIVDLQP